MKLHFLGACQEVTGSSYLLETANAKILIDCGIWQGAKFTEDRNYNDFQFDPKIIDFALLTHAHLDHCGRFPKLVKDGFNGKILATKPTVDFAQLMLKDSARVIVEEAEKNGYPPLYKEDDVLKCEPLFQGYNYNEIINLNNDVKICFREAGHILGSAIIEIWAEGKKIVFSGDLGNPPVPILKPTSGVLETDYLVMESTYGGKVHEDARTRVLMIASAIYETVTMKGALIIPAFALERTQELLFELNKLVENKDIPSVPVFLDSPLAIAATDVFRKHTNLYNKETIFRINSGDDIFRFPGLYFTDSIYQSKKINDAPFPKIIIAGSGMCQGGRIKYHLKRYLSDFKNQVLIIGYQVEGSLGRSLLDRNKKVNIDGDEVNVEAKIRAVGAYSAHADQPKLLKWLKGFNVKKPKHVFITHGEMKQAEVLSKIISDDLHLENSIPKQDEVIEL